LRIVAQLLDAWTSNARILIAAMQQEFGMVGDGLGSGFVNTQELHDIKFHEAVASENIKD
jgi:hypothetical protein